MELKLIESNTYGLFGSKWAIFYRSWENRYTKSSFLVKNIISREEYLKAKFGDNYVKILPLLEDENETCIKLKDWYILCCGFRNFFFQWFDSNGNLVKKREDIGSDSIYGFDVDDIGNIWYVMPTVNAVVQFSLKENRELYHSHEFNYPEDIKIYDNIAYISDMGSRRILTFDIKTYKLEEYMQFEEPVWEYLRVENREYVRLDSGLYIFE